MHESLDNASALLEDALTSTVLQGCCFSRPDGPNSPYPGGAPSGSARAINAPAASSQPGDDSAASPLSQANRPHRERHHHQPLSQHINKPLRRHEWASRHRVWTRGSLDQERIDFFDTRVTGRREIWQTLHAALDVLWEADKASNQGEASTTGGEDEPSVALATAQGILDAADITLPTGDLAQGAYDALGNYYSLPEWIVADPVNISQDAGPAFNDTKAALTTDVSCDERDVNEDELERRREEKGKAIATLENQISVRARLSETAQDVVILLSREGTVRSLARRVSEEARLPPTTRIRIAYLGKILKEASSLTAQGWKEGHVVNALMFDLR